MHPCLHNQNASGLWLVRNSRGQFSRFEEEGRKSFIGRIAHVVRITRERQAQFERDGKGRASPLALTGGHRSRSRS